MRTLLVMALLIIVLGGCNKLDSGTVISKRYEPARTYVAWMPLTMSTGKSIMVIMVPYTIYDNEDYVLRIKGKHKGKDIVESVYTSQSCYNKTIVGDHWAKTDDCSFKDNNNRKVRNAS